MFSSSSVIDWLMKLGGFPGKGISFLSGGFPKEVLLERKNRLAKLTADLKKEQAELSVFQQQLTYSDEKIATIEDFCTNIRERLDTLTFDGKRRIPEMLDVLGTLAIENRKIPSAPLRIRLAKTNPGRKRQ